MSTPSSDLPVLVSGGGIGGLAAALALVRQGFKVQVFEQAPVIGEIGAQKGEAVLALFNQPGKARFFERGIIIGVDHIDADHLVAARKQPRDQGVADEASGSCNEDAHRNSNMLYRESLGERR